MRRNYITPINGAYTSTKNPTFQTTRNALHMLRPLQFFILIHYYPIAKLRESAKKVPSVGLVSMESVVYHQEEDDSSSGSCIMYPSCVQCFPLIKNPHSSNTRWPCGAPAWKVWVNQVISMRSKLPLKHLFVQRPKISEESPMSGKSNTLYSLNSKSKLALIG